MTGVTWPWLAVIQLRSTEPPSFAIWDVPANQLLMENLGDALHFMGLEAHFSPDDQAILYLGYPVFPDFSGLATAYVFDARSGQIIRTFTPGGEALIRSAAWSPDGSQVATGLFNGDILIWDYQTGEQVARLVHDKDGFATAYVEWSPDGSKIAAASDDSNAHVWDARTWEPLFTVQHEPPIYLNVAAWSPDGKRLLTGGGNDTGGGRIPPPGSGTAPPGKSCWPSSGHTKDVWPGSWSPDGRRIATFGNDGTVRMWDATTGTELLTLTVPVLVGGSAWWSPDGQHLAIVGGETLISVWRVWQSTDELVAYAKECCVMRQLSEAERKQFALP